MTLLQVWAPAARSVAALVDRATVPLVSGEGGWWRADAPSAVHGTDYAFVLDGDTTPLPDPRSLWQPDGVHGASRVYDQDRFDWSDGSWRGVVLQGSVFYELHVGTFTTGGTLASALGPAFGTRRTVSSCARLRFVFRECYRGQRESQRHDEC